ncbi:MAG: hypothetical protein A3C07_03795 [Candidatus Sungbacteria bacterium RIFCSPHIGHO2_02_FULL_47_11]|uniref:Uncharacterized protein n=1 Tax=Candidatus Sungbacteria bacterium RIFCSPHIGHO2_02_FULL_47_11 TaxID=1802270 RepID=A0A1G2KMW0_9BACT|nr:MAG: hypothetical protein A3C07_03795 [Candidatus Sungbacteria bacterium RIFCSPHIGHO2_02_FULL_47_11]
MCGGVYKKPPRRGGKFNGRGEGALLVGVGAFGGAVPEVLRVPAPLDCVDDDSSAIVYPKKPRAKVFHHKIPFVAIFLFYHKLV